MEVTDRIAAGDGAQIVEKPRPKARATKPSVEQMYYGNQQFLFVYEQFTTCACGRAPPSSIGKFGGDTDNWIWPPPTGDFSMFPRLRFEGQPSGGLLAPERPLPSEKTLQHIHERG